MVTGIGVSESLSAAGRISVPARPHTPFGVSAPPGPAPAANGRFVRRGACTSNAWPYPEPVDESARLATMMRGMATNISIVPIGRKKCKPFILEVMVMNPEADFKFELLVEKECTKQAEPLWKLVFDLYKKNSKGEFVQIVHVSYKAQTPEEAAGIEATAINGASKKQADIAFKELHPVAKRVGEAGESDPEAEKKLLASMAKIAISNG
jgi:hypothetical protein